VSEKKKRKKQRMRGLERIALERNRQVSEENYSTLSDIEHNSHGELGNAAACYASGRFVFKLGIQPATTVGPNGKSDIGQVIFSEMWPWDRVYDKREKHSRIRQLEIAGALCAAEIDRLLAIKKGEREHEPDGG